MNINLGHQIYTTLITRQPKQKIEKKNPLIVFDTIQPRTTKRVSYDFVSSYYPNVTYLKPNINTANSLSEQEKSPLYQFNPEDSKDLIPTHFKKAFADKKANILGAGNIFSDFLQIGNIMNNYFQKENLNIFDPRTKNDIEFAQSLSDYNILGKESDIQQGSAFVFSPSKFHAQQVINLSQNKKLDGVYTDKPICIKKEELTRLNNAVRTAKTPLYFGDHFFYSNLAALRLMGVEMPYKDAIEIVSDNSKGKKFSKCIEDAKPYFKSNDISAIRTSMLEIGHHSLINRPWLQQEENGGGVLLDLQVHVNNLLNLMGLKITEIDSIAPYKYVFVGSAKAGVALDSEFSELPRHERGVFRAVKPNEVEDKICITGNINDSIPFTMEAAQYMDRRENYILIEGKNGEKIKCSTDVFDKKVELLDKNNKVIAEAKINAYPYSLMLHHAQSFFNDPNRKSNSMFFDIQENTMKQVFAIKDHIKKTCEPLITFQ